MKKLILPIAVVVVATLVAIVFLKGKDDPQKESGNGRDSVTWGGPSDEEADSLARARRERMDELANPQKFVRIGFDRKKKWLGSQSKVSGTLISRAKHVAYRDMELIVRFQRDGELVDSVGQMVYESLFPGDSLDFEFELKIPRKVNGLEMEVREARAN